MEIDWNQPFWFGATLGTWAVTAVAVAAPAIWHLAKHILRFAFEGASKNWARTLLTGAMVMGALTAFQFAGDSPITGSEALRMIIGCLIYCWAMHELIKLNRSESDHGRQRAEPNTAQGAPSALAGGLAPDDNSAQHRSKADE